MFTFSHCTITDPKKKRFMTLGKKEEDTLSVEIFTGQKWEWEAFRSETVDLKENGDQEKENSKTLMSWPLIYRLKSWKGDLGMCQVSLKGCVYSTSLCDASVTTRVCEPGKTSSCPSSYPSSQVPCRELQKALAAEWWAGQGVTVALEKGFYGSTPLGSTFGFKMKLSSPSSEKPSQGELRWGLTELDGTIIHKLPAAERR